MPPPHKVGSAGKGVLYSDIEIFQQAQARVDRGEVTLKKFHRSEQIGSKMLKEGVPQAFQVEGLKAYPYSAATLKSQNFFTQNLSPKYQGREMLLFREEYRDAPGISGALFLAAGKFDQRSISPLRSWDKSLAGVCVFYGAETHAFQKALAAGCDAYVLLPDESNMQSAITKAYGFLYSLGSSFMFEKGRISIVPGPDIEGNRDQIVGILDADPDALGGQTPEMLTAYIDAVGMRPTSEEYEELLEYHETGDWDAFQEMVTSALGDNLLEGIQRESEDRMYQRILAREDKRQAKPLGAVEASREKGTVQGKGGLIEIPLPVEKFVHEELTGSHSGFVNPPFKTSVEFRARVMQRILAKKWSGLARMVSNNSMLSPAEAIVFVDLAKKIKLVQTPLEKMRQGEGVLGQLPSDVAVHETVRINPELDAQIEAYLASYLPENIDPEIKTFVAHMIAAGNYDGLQSFLPYLEGVEATGVGQFIGVTRERFPTSGNERMIEAVENTLERVK